MGTAGSTRVDTSRKVTALIFSILIAVIALGFIIFWHELGHFLAAKRSGIRVEKFSIGFGPELVGFTRGETRYCLALLPFGGYVKMPGESPDDSTTGAGDEFSSASVEKRIFVAAAGPAMNILLGILAYGLIYILGVSVPRSVHTTEIGYVLPDYPAAIAGLQPGDKLLEIDGRKVHRWEDIQKRILVRPEEELQVLVERDGKQFMLNVTPKLRKADIGDVGQLGIDARTEVLVRGILPGSPASLADIRQDDLILRVNGQEVQHYESVYSAASATGDTVNLTLQRNEEAFDVQIPGEMWIQVSRLPEDALVTQLGVLSGDRLVELNGEPLLRSQALLDTAREGNTLKLGLLREDGSAYSVEITPEIHENTQEVQSLGGLRISEAFAGMQLGEPYDLQKYNIITAWGKGAEKSWSVVKEVFSVVRDLITGDVSPKYLSGPVGIVHLTAQMVSGGLHAALSIMAFISVNLAVVNLLPIPIADGGQIILFIMEKFQGQPLSQRKRIVIQQVGVGLILVIFALATWNDIFRIVKRFI